MRNHGRLAWCCAVRGGARAGTDRVGVIGVGRASAGRGCTREKYMEPLTLLGVLIGIVFIGYAVINIVFTLVKDVVTFMEANRMGVIIVVAILICLWFGLHS